MAAVSTLGKMEGATRAITCMIGSMATVSTLGVMGDSTKGTGTKEDNTVKERSVASVA